MVFASKDEIRKEAHDKFLVRYFIDQKKPLQSRIFISEIPSRL